MLLIRLWLLMLVLLLAMMWLKSKNSRTFAHHNYFNSSYFPPSKKTSPYLWSFFLFSNLQVLFIVTVIVSGTCHLHRFWLTVFCFVLSFKMSGDDFPSFGASTDPMREMRDRINRDREAFFGDEIGGPRRPRWPQETPFFRVRNLTG